MFAFEARSQKPEFSLDLLLCGFEVHGFDQVIQIRKTDKARFMNTAEISLEESRCFLSLAPDLGYGQSDALMSSAEEVSRPFWLLAPDFWLPYPAAL